MSWQSAGGVLQGWQAASAAQSLPPSASSLPLPACLSPRRPPHLAATSITPRRRILTAHDVWAGLTVQQFLQALGSISIDAELLG